MRINFVSFKGYDPYPVNGGKVEKLEYDTKQNKAGTIQTQTMPLLKILMQKKQKEIMKTD